MCHRHGLGVLCVWLVGLSPAGKLSSVELSVFVSGTVVGAGDDGQDRPRHCLHSLQSSGIEPEGRFISSQEWGLKQGSASGIAGSRGSGPVKASSFRF